MRSGDSGHPPAVSFTDTTVRVAARAEPILSEVTLSIEPGERVIVFGASGAGKSTLLRTISGVVPHSISAELRGCVRVTGVDTAESDVARLSRVVGVLAQDPQSALALPEVEQELALPLENRAVPAEQISGRIDGALTAIGADGLRMRTTSSLSGGEAQRVALAATLIADPQVLLLDEPTSMLDADGVSAVRDALVAVAVDSAAAIVLVEHRIDEFAGARGVAGLPQRAVVIGADGRVIADGPTTVVLSENGAALHAAGCWLPLETELAVVFGRPGGLADAGVRRALVELAGDGAHEDEGIDVAAAPVLVAEAVAVSRTPAARRKRHTRRTRSGRDREPVDAALTSVLPDTVLPDTVLHNVELSLSAGEIVAVLGRNGVGKSTLLLTLAGLLEPAAGAVRGVRPGMIFQNPEHQFVANTVRSEIAHGLDGPFVVSRVDAVLARYGLQHLAEQSPYRLSGGEKRRLSIAAMLVHDRPVLLADEPTYGLDRRATITVVRALEEAADAGRAILFSAHDLRTVASLAQRIVVVHEGRVVADGSSLDVLSDGPLLQRAGVSVPPLISFLVQECSSSLALRRALRALDDRVGDRVGAENAAERPEERQPAR